MSYRGISPLIGQHFVQQEAKGSLSFMSHLFLVSGYLGICDFEEKTNKILDQPTASRSGCVLQAQQAWSLMVSEAPPPPA